MDNFSSKKDNIYSSSLNQIPGFRFDQSVVDVFPDMIKRSVPGYEAIISMTGELVARYARANTRVYDLGCSLGASLLSMRHQISQPGIELIGVDNSEAMLSHCQTIIAKDPNQIPVTLCCENIEDFELQTASVVVLNFTLQFIALSKRLALIQKIYDSLIPGGVLIVSEKIFFADAHHQQLMTELHENYKRANGYSDLEISQKRTAIENVLIPEALDDHFLRFEQAGFENSDVWFQCLNFASMLAIKTTD